MFVTSALVLALSVTSAWSLTTVEPVPRAASREFVCGTTITAARKSASEARFRASKVEVSAARRKPCSTTVDVYWNIIQKDNTVEGGNITPKQIHDQIKVLNDAFVKTPYQFRLKNTKRVFNQTWFAQASPYEDGIQVQNEMKQRLRKGNEKTLNLYSVGFEEGEAAGGLLGYAVFPEWYVDAPWDDGVVFLHSSVPGGSTARFNLGGTVQHEVGHWVGLYHTFNEDIFTDTCDGSSDLVDDTPWERTPATGCPVGRDSCPNAPGLDPIHNYMDYTDDACYSEFTPGQIVRLTDQMATFRHL